MLITLAINVLWLAIGVLVILGAVYLALKVVKIWVEIDPKIEKAIWLIVMILCLIAGLSLLASGGGSLRPPFLTR